jgi:glucose-6-phosphate 1-epimerase
MGVTLRGVATLIDGARLETGSGGLSRLVLSTPLCEAHLYLHGAHLTHFQPAGQRPVLWLSRESQFASGKPIRGGVPLCFPWFGPHADDQAAPLHGFARLREWSLVEVREAAEGALVARLELSSDEASRRWLAQSFALQLSVTAGRSLHVCLGVANRGEQALRFAEALHTYFAVSDARRALVRGLEGARFLDKTDGGAPKLMGQEPLAIVAETDRVFAGHGGPITIEDPDWRRRLRITRSGSATAVVWNPWVAKAKAMPDFGDDEWTQMLCVESANALDDALVLPPGASHELATSIELLAA